MTLSTADGVLTSYLLTHSGFVICVILITEIG